MINPPEERHALSDLIRNKLQRAGWTFDCWTTFAKNKKLFVVRGQHGDGVKFIVELGEKLTGLLERERVVKEATKL